MQVNNNRAMNRNISKEDCAVAVALYEEGKSQNEIANRLNVTQSAISKVIKRFYETGTNERRAGQGRKRITSPQQDRYLRIQALRQRFVTSTSLQQEFSLTYDVRISQDTIRRRLKEDNITPYRAVTGPLLTAAHRRARLNFATEHLHWGEAEWSQVLFSDESKFSLNSDDRRRRVYRRPGERYTQCNVAETLGFGGGSIMVWGGISLQAHTELVIIDGGSLTSDRYITEILEPHVVPFAPFIGEQFIFMQDNARSHTARIVREYLDEVNIPLMNWPARSPDLNPIEHVWDNMGRQIRALQPPAITLNQLRGKILEIWEGIDQEFIRTLILSMGRRCQSVLNARGGNTRY